MCQEANLGGANPVQATFMVCAGVRSGPKGPKIDMFPHSSHLQEHATQAMNFGFFHRMGRPMYVSWQLRTTRLAVGMPNIMLQLASQGSLQIAVLT